MIRDIRQVGLSLGCMEARPGLLRAATLGALYGPALRFDGQAKIVHCAVINQPAASLDPLPRMGILFFA